MHVKLKTRAENPRPDLVFIGLQLIRIVHT